MTAATMHARLLAELRGAESLVSGDQRTELLADGSIRVTTVSTGRVAIYYADGSERLERSDGRFLLVSPNGTIEVRNRDGTLVRRQVTRRSSTAAAATSAAPATATSSWAAWTALAPATTGPVAPPAAPSSATPPPGGQHISLPDGSTMSLPPTGFSTVGGTSTPPPPPPSAPLPPPDAGTVVTIQGDRPPEMPTGLVARAEPGGGFRLAWKDASTDEIGFQLERNPAFTGGAKTFAAGTTEFSDADDLPQAGYRLRALGERLSSEWTAWADARSATADFVVLPPGRGFAGPTLQPAAVGTPEMAGYDAKAIARWDVVPYQTFTGNFHIGVVAFHMNGIDRVEFSADGGPWVPVTEMQLNPLTNVWEYTAVLRAGDFPDGPVEVRAVAYPKGAGEARVLGGALALGLATGEHSMFLSANAGMSLGSIEKYVSPTGNDADDGSLSQPFQSIMRAARAIQNQQGGNADGGKIYLLPGDHVYGPYSYALATQTSQRWLTITPAPGVARSEVRLVRPATSDGLRTRLVRLWNLTLAPATGAEQTILTSNGLLEDFAWVDSCELVGPGRTISASWSTGFSSLYVTDTSITASRDGLGGALVRNVNVGNIGSDAISGSLLAINCAVGRIDPSGTAFHADVLQYYGSGIHNVIAYGVHARSTGTQGFFAGDMIGLTDVAFVKCDIDNQSLGSSVMRVFQFGGPTTHMLVSQCTFVGPSTWMPKFTAKNIVLDDCSFTDQPDPITGVTVR